MKTEIRYLLKDKYGWGGISIQKYLDNKIEIGDSSILQDIKRLKSGEPLAYIIGWVDFLGSKIEVNKNVLIPRPETEFWVEGVINSEKLKNKNDKEFKVLDLCCGSGCIGISILEHIPNSHVTFVDISSNALFQTELNLAKSKIQNPRFRIIRSNLFNSLKDKYDLILTNPPYVSTKNTNPDLKYEPKEALYAGEDGLDLITKILKEFPKYLKIGGEIYIEISKDQKNTLQNLVSQQFNNFDFIKDQNNLPRVLKIAL